MKQWHFFDKVYRRWLVVVLCSLEDLRKDLEDNSYTHMDEIIPAKGMLINMTPENTSTGQNCYIIWMPVWETATLVHELSHLVMYSFDDVGIPISIDNTEGFAFYLEYWFNEIQRVRRRYPEGRAPKYAKR